MAPRHLHSCPTRRSSDLAADPVEIFGRGTVPEHLHAEVACPVGPGRLVRSPRVRGALQVAEQEPCLLWEPGLAHQDRKSTRLNSSHRSTSYAVLCLKQKNNVVQTSELYSLRHPGGTYTDARLQLLPQAKAGRLLLSTPQFMSTLQDVSYRHVRF